MNFIYMHKRKKPWKETVKRTRSLKYLMNKLIQQQEKVEDQHRIWITCPGKYYERKRVICKALTQQKQIFETGKSVLDRIVSITKSYVRPIVRGKEVKKVEFGAKMNLRSI